MEAWLAELEMELNVNSNPVPEQLQPQSPTHCMKVTPFDEQLVTAVGNPLPSESNTSSPQAALDYFDHTHFIEPFTPQFRNNDNNNNEAVRVIDDDGGETRQQPQEAAKMAAKVGRKRKREPSELAEHIMAERKRREQLARLFISLSAIIPGLKKIDKSSVLREAIKYMKQLQEKVKVLEEAEAKRTMEAVVEVMKKSQLVVDDEAVDDNGSLCLLNSSLTGDSGGGGGGGGGCGNESNESLPRIEVKASGKTLLFRVCCEKQWGILAKLFREIEKQDAMNIISCNILPFGSMDCDITIVVQKDEKLDMNVRDLVRSLRSVFLLA